jgi:hypothetical protein
MLYAAQRMLDDGPILLDSTYEAIRSDHSIIKDAITAPGSHGSSRLYSQDVEKKTRRCAPSRRTPIWITPITYKAFNSDYPVFQKAEGACADAESQ